MSSSPDISQLDGVVAPKILDAMRAASAELSAHGIRHALVGGLAVGAHGWPRATKDVDFILGPEGFEMHAGGIVTFAPGVPLRVGNVPVDPILPAPSESHLDRDLDRAIVSDGVPVAPIEALVYMKLRSPRKKDKTDIIELAKTAGFDEDLIRVYLEENAQELVDAFDQIVDEAQGELSEG
jgi:hypothetical protein